MIAVLVVIFVGAMCYVDDIVDIVPPSFSITPGLNFLLAPCAPALRILLSVCESYAVSHGLVFNASKTQLIVVQVRQMSSLHHFQ